MKLNPIQLEIYSCVDQDMKKHKRNFSTLTNNEISKTIGVSAFSIRDHVVRMVNKGIFQRVLNHWTEDKKFYNRVLYKSSKIVE